MTAVKGWVHLVQDGQTVSFSPGEVLPEWAVPMVTNPKLIGEAEAPKADAKVEVEPEVKHRRKEG